MRCLVVPSIALCPHVLQGAACKVTTRADKPRTFFAAEDITPGGMTGGPAVSRLLPLLYTAL